ncbi:DMT family transporter [Allomuricauda sp. SCSIO 65647]|uniref:DMT family transporter n=1 Tax=Allomuricauda sp. SCSIO 65647 TaxID=2908843 RepID=UPI001F345E29|nr:DMT family transporter [Muricauda sp. SCSIO 65647]UJH67616.1 DMT family transporter [Muricauda sp. SCSIO 65647]
MIDLALSIFCSSLIFVVFKLYSRFNIETFYAIVVNYVVACTTGLLFYEKKILIGEVMQASWIWGTLLLGVLFITVFNLMAKTSQENGVSVASVATKMSLVIPVLLGVALYNEKLSFLNIIGILLALVAVYFASVKKNRLSLSKSSLLLPVLVFLGSGIIDSSIKYVQETQLEKSEFPLFSSVVFAAAALTGIMLILVKLSKTSIKFNARNIMGGIALGVPNYFSIFFLLRALQNEQLNSASIFTINNVAIVMFSTLLGILLFKEELSSKNWLGVGFAVVSILLVALF